MAPNLRKVKQYQYQYPWEYWHFHYFLMIHFCLYIAEKEDNFFFIFSYWLIIIIIIFVSRHENSCTDWIANPLIVLDILYLNWSTILIRNYYQLIHFLLSVLILLLWWNLENTIVFLRWRMIFYWAKKLRKKKK